MKFCKDCEHFIVPSDGDLRYAKCGKYLRSAPTTDLVTGEPTPAYYYYCATSRDSNIACGQSGKWFEPRKQEAAE